VVSVCVCMYVCVCERERLRVWEGIQRVWVCLRVCCVDVGEVVSSRLLFVMWYLCVCVYVYVCV